MDFDPFSKPSSPSIEIIEHILSIGILALSAESQTDSSGLLSNCMDAFELMMSIYSTIQQESIYIFEIYRISDFLSL